jgi:hypothetical protein
MHGHDAPGVSATSAPKGNWRSDDQAKRDAASTKPEPHPSTIRKAWRTGDSKSGQHDIPQGVKDPDKIAARSPGQAIARAKERKAGAEKAGVKPKPSYVGTKLPGFRKREWADKAQWQKDRAKQGAKQESFFGHEFALYESMQEGMFARAGQAIKKAISGKPKAKPETKPEGKPKAKLPHETRSHDIHNAMRFRGPTKGAAGRAHARKAVKHFNDMAAQSKSRGTEDGSDHQWFKTAAAMSGYGRNSN